MSPTIGFKFRNIYFNITNIALCELNFCLPRLERGIAPACVRQCPGGAVWTDYLDNEEGSVYKLVKEWKVALPLHPEFNTQPNVYYVPPMSSPRLDQNGDFDLSEPRIPLEYLRSLFGPGVDHALDTLKAEMAKRRAGRDSELTDLLIARRWPVLLGPFPKDPSEVTSAT